MDPQPTRTELQRVMERHAQMIEHYRGRRLYSDADLTQHMDTNVAQITEEYRQDIQSSINQAFISDGSGPQVQVSTSTLAGPQFELLNPYNFVEDSFAHVMRYYTYNQRPWSMVSWDEVNGTMAKFHRKRVARIRTATDAEMAKKMSKYSKKIAKDVSQQMMTVAAAVQQAQQVFKKKNQAFMKAGRRLKIYVPTIERLQKTDEQICLEFEKILVQTRKMRDVAKIEMDGRGRIIVTTKLLYTKHDHWKRRRNIGVYQIRIDFSRQYPTEGVSILNTTRRFGHYDSPTISNTQMCTGNFYNDLKRDYYTQNLPELVYDVLDYIQSPRTRAGYIGLHGDKNKAWDAFLQSAKMMPKGFTFHDYDRDYAEHETSRVTIENVEQLEDVRELLDNKEEEYKRSLQYANEQIREYQAEVQRLSDNITTNYQNLLWMMVRNMGVRDELTRYYYRTIMMRGYDEDEEHQDEVNEIIFRKTDADCVAMTVKYTMQRGTRFVTLYAPIDDFGEPIGRKFGEYIAGEVMWKIARLSNNDGMRLLFGWRTVTPDHHETFDSNVLDVPRIEPTLSTGSTTTITMGDGTVMGVAGTAQWGLATYGEASTAGTIAQTAQLQRQVEEYQARARIAEQERRADALHRAVQAAHPGPISTDAHELNQLVTIDPDAFAGTPLNPPVGEIGELHAVAVTEDGQPTVHNVEPTMEAAQTSL